jgi:hypothetical protein
MLIKYEGVVIGDYLDNLVDVNGVDNSGIRMVNGLENFNVKF